MKQSRAADVVAWMAIALAVVGLVGCLQIGAYGGACIWVAIAAAVSFDIIRRRRRRASAAAAEIAARAERENELYLEGDSSGLYGQYRPES